MSATSISRLQVLLKAINGCVGDTVYDNQNLSFGFIRNDREGLFIMMGSYFMEIFLKLPSELIPATQGQLCSQLFTCFLENDSRVFANSSRSWRGPSLTHTKPFSIDSLILNNNEMQ